ncbi:HAD family hydrolase [Saccharopolyspora cebuensis]|uniref:HAD family hydrolase n=1 Tax=Saccharopolyspora cebuensis TaxID=418759 RepID=A0ABV4CKV2_9PSEU
MPDATWKPRLIALDVDGTLLDPDTQTISAAVRTSVRRAVDAGAEVIVATGRSMLGALPVLADLGLTRGVALCSNGAVVLDAATGEAVSVETFEPAPVVAELARRVPGSILAVERLGEGNLVTAPFGPDELHGPQHVGTIEDVTAGPVPRLVANWVGHEPAEVVAAMRGAVLPGATFTLDHYEPWVTVVPQDVTKGAALEKLRAELGVPAAETFAAGDGDNDVQMLEWAAHGVAMGQGPAVVHAAADEVTAPVAEDGLATALDRWFR